MRNLFETCIDVGSGLILSTMIQLFIFPFFGLYPTVLESFHIAVVDLGSGELSLEEGEEFEIFGNISFTV